MIDNRAEIYSILKELPAEVTYRYPQNLLDNQYPKISYFISNTTDTMWADNEAQGATIECTVQVYEKNIQGEIVEIHGEMDAKMKANGFMRAYYDNYFDIEDKTHIHTFRYTKKYEYKRREANE